MTQGRESKIHKYNLEGEAIDLLKQGLGPQRIANVLMKRHPEITPPLSHVNVISFRDALAPTVFKAIEAEHMENMYIKPIDKLRGEMDVLKEAVFPQLIDSINRRDVKAVRTLSKSFMDTWDRIAKIEELLNPTSAATGKVVHIQQQFNLIKDRLAEVFTELCPECRKKVLELTKDLASPVPKTVVNIVDAEFEDVPNEPV